jgi:hypothetical protein
MRIKLLAVASAAFIACAASANAGTLALDIGPGAGDYGGSVWNLGWSFTVNSTVTAVGLGNWAGASFPQDQQVGLWDSAGTLLASSYVSNADALVGTGPWRFAVIAPVTLVAGQTYVVGGEGGADYTGNEGVGTVTIDPRITYGTDLYTYNGGANSPLVEPTSTESRPYGWFGGNVELGAAVPEPAAWSLMLVGIGGLGGLMRARRPQVAATA